MRMGKSGGLVNSALEVHELKVTTEALRAANQRFFAHGKQPAGPWWSWMPQLGLVHCSSRATEWFGWHHAAHHGESLLNLVGDGARVSALRKAFHRLLAGAERQNRVEASFIRPDGSVQHCMWSRTLRSSIRAARRCPSCARSRTSPSASPLQTNCCIWRSTIRSRGC